jgi:hypothetical protein
MINQRRGFVFIATLEFLFLLTAGWVEALTKPDLKVTELTAEKLTTTTVPLRIKVALRILNAGTTTGAVTFKTRLSYRRSSTAAWETLYDWSSGALGPNGGAYYSRTFDFTEGGIYYFKAEVDADKNVTEYSEGNNTKTLTETFAAGTPDLTPTNLAAAITSTTSSGTSYVKVEWDVKNIGDGKAAGSFVTVLYVSRNSGSYAEVQRYTRYNLDKNLSLHFSRSAPYTDFNSLRFRVITDATYLIHERQEGNNTLHSNVVTKRP